MTRAARHANLLFDRIKQAVPDAELAVSDYGLSFTVFTPSPRWAVILSRAARPDIGQTRVRLTKKHLPAVIRLLSGASP